MSNPFSSNDFNSLNNSYKNGATYKLTNIIVDRMQKFDVGKY